jgi:hypothetical protein
MCSDTSEPIQLLSIIFDVIFILLTMVKDPAICIHLVNLRVRNLAKELHVSSILLHVVLII